MAVNSLSELEIGIPIAQQYRDLGRDIFLCASPAIRTFKPLQKGDTQRNHIQVVDFFSGAGGTSLGFYALNSLGDIFHFLGGCDIDPNSAASYSANFGTPLLCRNIIEVASSDVEIDSFLNEIEYNRNEPSIFIGCAPCQGFTSHRKRHWNEKDDKRNVLATAFARIVKRANPTALIMENVPEFLS